jgi:hypothetical protein
MMSDNFGVTERNWRDALRPGSVAGYPTAPEVFALSESPRYVGAVWRHLPLIPTATGGTSGR